MDSKLQALTDKIYQEGIAKANTERDKILSLARDEATRVVKKARDEAASIVADAERQAAELRKNVQAEVRLSAQQAISELKRRISELIVTEVLTVPVQKAFDDTTFMKKLIETIVKNWNPLDQDKAALSLLLPSELEQEFLAHFKNKLHQQLNAELTVFFDAAVQRGFKIGPRDNSYHISFTDKDFENFIRDYLRPRTMKILYGEEK